MWFVSKYSPYNRQIQRFGLNSNDFNLDPVFRGGPHFFMCYILQTFFVIHERSASCLRFSLSLTQNAHINLLCSQFEVVKAEKETKGGLHEKLRVTVAVLCGIAKWSS